MPLRNGASRKVSARIKRHTPERSTPPKLAKMADAIIVTKSVQQIRPLPANPRLWRRRFSAASRGQPPVMARHSVWVFLQENRQ